MNICGIPETVHKAGQQNRSKNIKTKPNQMNQPGHPKATTHPHMSEIRWHQQNVYTFIINKQEITRINFAFWIRFVFAFWWNVRANEVCTNMCVDGDDGFAVAGYVIGIVALLFLRHIYSEIVY